MNAPSISVCMPVYNVAPFIDAAIASIRNQSFSDFEFIVVDDGSTDATASVVERHAAEDSRLRLIRLPHSGVVAASNAALAAARGRTVARMDGDDVALPQRLALTFDCLERHPEVGIVGAAAALIGPEGQPLRILRPPLEHEAVARAFRTRNVMMHPTVLMRRDLIVALGGYRAAFEYAEDTDLWLRAIERTRIVNLPDVLVQVRRHFGKVSFRRAERQAVASAAARAAAALRRRGRPDPVGDAPALTEAHFEQLGMPPGVRHRHICSRLRDSIRFGVLDGDADYSWALLERLREQASPAEYLAALHDFRTALDVNPALAGWSPRCGSD